MGGRGLINFHPLSSGVRCKGPNKARSDPPECRNIIPVNHGRPSPILQGVGWRGRTVYFVRLFVTRIPISLSSSLYAMFFGTSFHLADGSVRRD